MPTPPRRVLFAFAVATLLARLPAQSPAPIEVHVEDDRGRPAAGVELRLGIDSGDVFGFSPLSDIPPAVTDRDGIARLQPGPATPATNLFVEAKVLAEPPVRLGLSTRTGPGPAVLRLPPLGAVRVLVYGFDEHPLPGVTAVSLSLAGNQRFFDRVEPPGTLQPEGALFSRVALGQRVLATARIAGTHGELRVEAAGPAHAGELVVVELRLAQAHLLTARVIGLDGKPAANALLPGFLVDADAARTIGVSTDVEGRLRFLVPDLGVGRPDGAVVIARRGPGGDGAETEYLGSARIPTAEPWTGERAVGDVVLQKEEPIAAGRLLDDDGKPLAGVLLTATPSQLAGARISESNSDAFGHRVRTDAEGNFVIREAAPRTATLRLEATGVTLRGDGGIAVGDQQAEVHGSRRGEVFVGLPGLPAGVRVRYLRFRGAPRQQPGFGGDGGEPPHVTSVADGVLLPDVAAGTYDLVAGTMYGFAEHVLGKGLEVRPGAATPDPRLSFPDWRQHLWVCRYTVGGDPALARGAQVLAVVVGNGGHSSQGFGHVGSAPRALLLPREHRLTVQGPACCTAVVEPTDAPVEIVLRPRPVVLLRLPDGVTLPAGLRLVLVPKERPWTLESGHVQTDGTAQWTVRPDGDGVFAARLETPRGDGGHDEVWKGELTVPAGAGPHPLVLPIDPETARELRERAAPGKK